MGKVLVACEFSGVVRDAFTKAGHHAVSCDLLATDSLGYHYQGDVRDILTAGWDLMIAHPDCTFLTGAGLHWNGRIEGRAKKTQEAYEFFMELYNAPIPCIAVENPVGAMSTMFRKPDQIIQPWQFGHPYSKRTCLWLKNLPLLKHTDVLEPPMLQANGRPRWLNQTPTGQNSLGPSADRWKLRSRTYEGIADAMATQWGPIINA